MTVHDFKGCYLYEIRLDADGAVVCCVIDKPHDADEPVSYKVFINNPYGVVHTLAEGKWVFKNDSHYWDDRAKQLIFNAVQAFEKVVIEGMINPITKEE